MANTERTTRNLSGFTGIDLRGAGQIKLTQGKDFSIVIEAEPHILEIVTTTLKGDILEIGFETGTKSIQTSEQIIYTITMPQIAFLKISGGGSLQCERIGGKALIIDLPGGSSVDIGTISVQDFTLDVRGGTNTKIGSLQAATVNLDMRGGGNIKFDKLEADHLTTDVRGAVKISAVGRVTGQDIRLPGAGNINYANVQSRHVSVNSMGVGKVTVWASDTLDIQSSGGGTIHYFGNPKLTPKISGIGSVKRAGEAPITTA